MQFSNLCIHLATVCGPDVILDTGNYIVKKHRDVSAIIFLNIPVGGHRERKQKIKNYDVKAGTVTAVMWRRCCLLAC